MRSLLIGSRFNGPRSSANGGYTAGALAEASGLSGEVTVRLVRPPPLGTPLTVAADGDEVQLLDGTDVVAVAAAGRKTDWSDAEPVPLEKARRAEAAYAGLRSHPFPRCFVCGPERAPGDGLRIFPGRLDDARVAATWVPHPEVTEVGRAGVPVTWAALDCVSGWSSDLEARPMVLAEMVARVRSWPETGTAYVVVGRHLGTDGRKTRTASALLEASGRTIAEARQLWIAVDDAVLRRLEG